jgi:hypothetical protein
MDSSWFGVGEYAAMKKTGCSPRMAGSIASNTTRSPPQMLASKGWVRAAREMPQLDDRFLSVIEPDSLSRVRINARPNP